MTEAQRKEIVDVMQLGFDIQNFVELAKKDDGKVTPKDLLVNANKTLEILVKSLPEAIKGIDKIPASFSEFNKEDKEYFVNHFKSQFDIADDKLESRIERVFTWTVDTLLMVSGW